MASRKLARKSGGGMSGTDDVLVVVGVVGAAAIAYYAWKKFGPVPTSASIVLAPGAQSVRVNGALTVSLPTGATWGVNTLLPVTVGGAAVTVQTSVVMPSGQTTTTIPVLWVDATQAQQTTQLTVTSV